MPQKLILLVDDEPMITGMLRLHLEAKGYQVQVANDGDAGLKIVRKFPPDLIVLDINMPRKDGLDFYRGVCSEHGRVLYPVLIMTGRGEMKEVFQGLEVAGFIGKPFEIKDFLSRIADILEHPKPSNVFLLDLTSSEHALKIAELLEKERYQVTQIVHLNELKEFIASRPPDFIVMEYAQSQMAGDQMIAAIRKIFSESPLAGRKIPILVYTYSGMDYREKSLNAGADKYLGVPKSHSDVVAAVCEMERLSSKEKEETG